MDKFYFYSPLKAGQVHNHAVFRQRGAIKIQLSHVLARRTLNLEIHT